MDLPPPFAEDDYIIVQEVFERALIAALNALAFADCRSRKGDYRETVVSK